MTRIIALISATAFAVGLSTAAMACEFNKMAEHDSSKIDTAQLEENVKKADAQLESMKKDTEQAEQVEQTGSPNELAKVAQESDTQKN